MIHSSRSRILSIYRRLLKLSQTWIAKNPDETVIEREYIRDETKNLFRSNRKLKDTQIIHKLLQEAETRLELTLHYRTPYPRALNFPLLHVSKSKGRGKQKRFQQAIPVYLKTNVDDKID